MLSSTSSVDPKRTAVNSLRSIATSASNYFYLNSSRLRIPIEVGSPDHDREGVPGSTGESGHRQESCPLLSAAYLRHLHDGEEWQRLRRSQVDGPRRSQIDGALPASEVGTIARCDQRTEPTKKFSQVFGQVLQNSTKTSKDADSISD